MRCKGRLKLSNLSQWFYLSLIKASPVPPKVIGPSSGVLDPPGFGLSNILFGPNASDIVYWRSVVLAKLNRLPVMFLCSNNTHMKGRRRRKASSKLTHRTYKLWKCAEQVSFIICQICNSFSALFYLAKKLNFINIFSLFWDFLHTNHKVLRTMSFRFPKSDHRRMPLITC